MKYFQVKPPEPLSRHIECLWYLETDTASPVAQRIVPDGCMELVLHAGEPFTQLKHGCPQRQDRAMLCGQLTAPIFLAQNSRGRVFGIRFRPGAAALLRIPMADLADHLVPLDQLSAHLHRDLMDALQGEVPLPALARLSAILQTQLASARSSASLEYAASRIRDSNGLVSLLELSRELGVTERQLQRLFRQGVGITPKMLCRVTRFQNVLARLDAHSERWADAAVDAAYYDQSHLLRDFRQFAGATPTFLISPSTDLAEHFTRREGSQFSKTPAAEMRDRA